MEILSIYGVHYRLEWSGWGEGIKFIISPSRRVGWREGRSLEVRNEKWADAPADTFIVSKNEGGNCFLTR